MKKIIAYIFILLVVLPKKSLSQTQKDTVNTKILISLPVSGDLKSMGINHLTVSSIDNGEIMLIDLTGKKEMAVKIAVKQIDPKIFTVSFNEDKKGFKSFSFVKGCETSISQNKNLDRIIANSKAILRDETIKKIEQEDSKSADLVALLCALVCGPACGLGCMIISFTLLSKSAY